MRVSGRWSLGCLEDRSGDDRYSSIQYSLASAPHMALACFVDLAGDDAEILADVYLAMTGGQVMLSLGGDTGPATGVGQVEQIRRIAEDRPRLRVIRADSEETAQHLARLEAIAKALGGASVWEQLDNKPDC